MRYLRNNKAFTLIEILVVVVVLGILAAIVMPDLRTAAQQSKEATLRAELRYMRSQIQSFNLQFGQPPATDLNQATFVQQMTAFLDSSMGTAASRDATHNIGPYLVQMPYNPTNNNKTIKFVTSSQIGSTSDDSFGWLYCPDTMDFYAANGIYSPAQQKW